jgi:hypothetical protein
MLTLLGHKKGGLFLKMKVCDAWKKSFQFQDLIPFSNKHERWLYPDNRYPFPCTFSLVLPLLHVKLANLLYWWTLPFQHNSTNEFSIGAVSCCLLQRTPTAWSSFNCTCLNSMDHMTLCDCNKLCCSFSHHLTRCGIHLGIWSLKIYS